MKISSLLRGLNHSRSMKSCLFLNLFVFFGRTPVWLFQGLDFVFIRIWTQNGLFQDNWIFLIFYRSTKKLNDICTLVLVFRILINCFNQLLEQMYCSCINSAIGNIPRFYTEFITPVFVRSQEAGGQVYDDIIVIITS